MFGGILGIAIMAKNFLSINDLSREELIHLLDRADALRTLPSPMNSDPHAGILAGSNIALLFEKPSLRTKVSFDIAISRLGGHSIFLGNEEVGLDVRERVEDVGRVLGKWCSGIVARVFSQTALQRLADSSNVPVINALSDTEHPCQAVADVLTIRRTLGTFHGVTVAYVGDANNCALSLGIACAILGINFRIASPAGFGFDSEILKSIEKRYGDEESGVQIFPSAELAVAEAHVIYTDVWSSMGQEAQAEQRRNAFHGFQVDEQLMAVAAPNAILMHPMPAHYGDEVAPGMLDAKYSAAFDQAENRLYAQMAILEFLFGLTQN